MITITITNNYQKLYYVNLQLIVFTIYKTQKRNTNVSLYSITKNTVQLINSN